MRFNASVLLVAGLAAFSVSCKEDKTETGDSVPIDEGCTVEIEETYPLADSTDFYYRAAIEFQLTDADTETTPAITLTAGGTEVAGTTSASEDGETIYFTPSAPLACSTDYAATLTYCKGDATINFRTSELGCTPDTGPDGKTYALEIGSARILQPAAAAGLLEQYKDQIPTILIGVTGTTTSTISFMGAIAAEGSDPPAQDMCQVTIPMPDSDFTGNPYFQLGPADLTFDISGYSVPIYSLMISGTFAPDASYFGGGVLQGEVDARDIVSLVPDVESADDVCELVGSFGAPCEACSSDSQPYCLTVMADQIKAEEVPGLTLTQIDVDPGCADAK